MDRDAFVAILNPMVLALRGEFDRPTWSAYYAVLKTVPAPLLEAARDAVLAEDRAFVPTAPELRAYAEKARARLLALNPYAGCPECVDSVGWRPVLVAGVPKVEACPCKARYAQRLADLGVTREPLTLPAARREFEAVGEVE